MIRKIFLVSLITLIAATGYAYNETRQYRDYQDVISKTAGMTHDPEVRALAERFGLTILDLTWEDTGRYKNSSVGPNISDMTIQIQQKDPLSNSYYLTCMPVIRYPNFSDTTADVPLDKFYILTGNEKGRHLRKITLREFLGNLRQYLHEPDSWRGYRNSLLAGRDSHVLVSAQACFLPIPRESIAEFNPVLFNYQSMEGDPAVLTILVTREGTSVTVIDNKRDRFQAGYTWGQRLFFNQNGERASLTGKRLSEYTRDIRIYGPDSGSGEKTGLNMVLLIQVPLKQKNPMRFGYLGYDAVCKSEAMPSMRGNYSDVENAVIGHGRVEGPFTEIAGLDIERDPSFPIRATVQFYKATSNGEITENDMRQIADQINTVYTKADYVGSLVVGGYYSNRPTEYSGDKSQPREWWESFQRRHSENFREDPEPLPWGISE